MNRYQKYRSYGHGRFTAATLALPMPLFLGCAVAVGLIVGLSGCNTESEPPSSRDVAQASMDQLIPVCRDGVQYLAAPYSLGPSWVATPRMKRDGTVYSCMIRREPTRIVEEWEQ